MSQLPSTRLADGQYVEDTADKRVRRSVIGAITGLQHLRRGTAAMTRGARGLAKSLHSGRFALQQLAKVLLALTIERHLLVHHWCQARPVSTGFTYRLHCGAFLLSYHNSGYGVPARCMSTEAASLSPGCATIALPLAAQHKAHGAHPRPSLSRRASRRSARRRGPRRCGSAWAATGWRRARPHRSRRARTAPPACSCRPRPSRLMHTRQDRARKSAT